MNERYSMNEKIRELAEEAGLLGPRSRVGKAHEAVEKFAGLVLDYERKVNGPTYFTDDHAASMTLRDHFAGLAMQAILMQNLYPFQKEAKTAYALADAMLEERKK
jgi:hypothetical protein